MKGKFYSNSKLNTFEQCRLKYKFRYIDKIKPEIEQTIEMHLGKMVHNTLEWVYLRVREGTIPTLDEVIEYYALDWKETYKPEFVIVNDSMNAKDYLEKGVEYLINYYTKHQPFDDNTLDVEKRIIFNLDQDGKYKILGFIDRLVYNLEKSQYEVHDYKTSASMPRQEDIDNDRQLAFYSIAIKEEQGYEEEVILVWHYLAHNKKIDSTRTNTQLEQLKKETLDLIREIENTIEFPPTKSRLCDWCEYKDICPAWNNKPKREMQGTL
ncbi:RecB family exonuclease [Nanoarchaeota archaeon]